MTENERVEPAYGVVNEDADIDIDSVVSQISSLKAEDILRLMTLIEKKKQIEIQELLSVQAKLQNELTEVSKKLQELGYSTRATGRKSYTKVRFILSGIEYPSAAAVAATLGISAYIHSPINWAKRLISIKNQPMGTNSGEIPADVCDRVRTELEIL